MVISHTHVSLPEGKLVCISWGCWGGLTCPVGRARPQDHQLWRFHRAVARRACCNFNSWANGANPWAAPQISKNGPVFTPWYKQYTPYIWVKYFVKLILLLQSHPIYIIFTPWVNWWLKYTQWYIGQSTTFFLDVNHPVVLSLQDFYRIPTRRFDWTTDIGVPNPKSETSRSALLVTKMPVISISLDSPPVSFNGCIVNPRSGCW